MSNLRRLGVAACAVVLGLSGAVAGAAEEVNVYSYRQPFLIKPMFDAFTRATGVRVNTVFADKGLVERLKREGDNSPADLIFTVDIGRLQDAKDAGVTQAVDDETLEANIPAAYRDPEGHWFGLTARARIIVASKERVQPGEITRYEQLAEPEWRGRVCTRSGKHDYMVALTASMIVHHGAEQAQQWLSGLKDNLARKPQGNDRGQVKAIKEGECDVAVINSYYMGHMLADEEQSVWADAVDVIFPNQDGRGTHMNVSGMALTHSAPNKENALKLMAFLSDDLAQQMYSEQNYEYPLKAGVPRSGLLQALGDFKADDVGLAEIADHRREAILMADTVGYDN